MEKNIERIEKNVEKLHDKMDDLCEKVLDITTPVAINTEKIKKLEKVTYGVLRVVMVAVIGLCLSYFLPSKPKDIQAANLNPAPIVQTVNK